MGSVGVFSSPERTGEDRQPLNPSPPLSSAPTLWIDRLKIVLPHLGLVLMCVLYTLAGAMAFYWIERANEEETRARGVAVVRSTRSAVVAELWALAAVADEAEWRGRAAQLLDNLTGELFGAFEDRAITADVLLLNDTANFRWTFPSAIFFSATTITTIGYGNLVPQTSAGRAVCVVFGLFGIPLMLVTIADIGKFIGDGILEAYERYQKLRRRLRWKLREERRASEMILPPLDNTIPTQLIVAIIVGYTALGGVLLPIWELDWDFYDSSYFSFITMSTIGFGDRVPKNQMYYWATLIYIILGLAISTMCVDLVGGQYIQKIHYFGRKIQNARDALRTVGDLVRYTHFLKRKYTGVKEADLRKLMVGTDWDEFLASNLPFTPKEISRFPFIDHSSARSAALSNSTGRPSSAFDVALPKIDEAAPDDPPPNALLPIHASPSPLMPTPESPPPTHLLPPNTFL